MSLTYIWHSYQGEQRVDKYEEWVRPLHLEMPVCRHSFQEFPLTDSRRAALIVPIGLYETAFGGQDVVQRIHGYAKHVFWMLRRILKFSDAITAGISCYIAVSEGIVEEVVRGYADACQFPEERFLTFETTSINPERFAHGLSWNIKFDALCHPAVQAYPRVFHLDASTFFAHDAAEVHRAFFEPRLQGWEESGAPYAPGHPFYYGHEQRPNLMQVEADWRSPQDVSLWEELASLTGCSPEAEKAFWHKRPVMHSTGLMFGFTREFLSRADVQQWLSALLPILHADESVLNMLVRLAQLTETDVYPLDNRCTHDEAEMLWHATFDAFKWWYMRAFCPGLDAGHDRQIQQMCEWWASHQKYILM